MNSSSSPQEKTSKADSRFPLTVGLSVGIAIPVARDVEQALTNPLGYWPALGISLLAAAGTGAILAVIINLVLSCWWPKEKTANDNGIGTP